MEPKNQDLMKNLKRKMQTVTMKKQRSADVSMYNQYGLWDQINLGLEFLRLDFDVVDEGVNCRISMSSLS